MSTVEAIERARAWRERCWEENRPLIEAKRAAGCVKCGATENLHFHHVDRSTKEHDVSHLFKSSRARLLRELAKCVVLCESCHRATHRAEGGFPKSHCKRGHVLSPENVRVEHDGDRLVRRCRECRNAYDRAFRAKRTYAKTCGCGEAECAGAC